MTNVADDDRIVKSRHRHFKPIPHSGTTKIIPKGNGGVSELPVAINGRMTQSAWVIPAANFKAFRKSRTISIVVVTDDHGNVTEMSIAIPEVVMTKQ